MYNNTEWISKKWNANKLVPDSNSARRVRFQHL